MTRDEILKELKADLSITLPVSDWMCIGGALKTHPEGGEFSRQMIDLLHKLITQKQKAAHEEVLGNDALIAELHEHSFKHKQAILG